MILANKPAVPKRSVGDVLIPRIRSALMAQKRAATLEGPEVTQTENNHQ